MSTSAKGDPYRQLCVPAKESLVERLRRQTEEARKEFIPKLTPLFYKKIEALMDEESKRGEYSCTLIIELPFEAFNVKYASEVVVKSLRETAKILDRESLQTKISVGGVRLVLDVFWGDHRIAFK